jgi:hypothetical protein
MLNKQERIQALIDLGKKISQSENSELFELAKQRNGFFIPEFCQKAVESILPWLEKKTIENWAIDFSENEILTPKKIGIILAGNIPLVGWHDLMTTFVSGNIAHFKPSSNDEVLIDWLLSRLFEVAPKTKGYFQKTEQMKSIDAIIATGSSNTATYFHYYFKTIPRLIRGSKSSLALIYGFENQKELEPLTDDILQYFGLGCRNVSKLLVPEDYDFDTFFNALEKYRFLTDHHKFQNNAIYHKSIFYMNGDTFLDNDILMLRPNPSIYSPISVVNYETYTSLDHAKQLIDGHKADIQCLLSHNGQLSGSSAFGTAQSPAIDQYADGVNTMDFLLKLADN